MKNIRIPKSINMISSKILAEETIKRGIKINHINSYQKEMAFLELVYKKHYEYILGSNISKTTVCATYAVENKSLTKSLLTRAKISVAKGKLFSKKNINEVYKFIDRIKYPIVIKPFDGAHGDMVFIGIKNKNDFNEKLKKIFQKHEYVLVEKEFKGKEFRFIAGRNKIFAVAHREPANVIGDGIHTIRELIKIKNQDPKRGKGHIYPLTKIEINNITKQYLKEQKIELEKVLSSGKKIYLRKNSNLSTGGDSIDVTDQVHPELKKIAVKTICAIPGFAYGGIDIMINKDISKKPTKNSYIVIELNPSPGLRMHHFPAIGKPRNVAKEIIDILFPETKGKYIK
ncbi:carboxylate--amine ligase [Patescibacteria group bacterium]|nr:carboxylate--amine ligase [Patescibacteria group bacterium]